MEILGLFKGQAIVIMEVKDDDNLNKVTIMEVRWNSFVFFLFHTPG